MLQRGIPFIKNTLSVVLLLLPFLATGQVTIQVRVRALYTGTYESGAGAYEHRWKFKYTTSNFSDTNYGDANVWPATTPDCFSVSSKDNGWFPITHTDIDLGTGFPAVPDAVRLCVEGWEEDRGSGCNFDNRDDAHAYESLPIYYLKDLAPGVWSQAVAYGGSGYKYGATIQMRYSLPPPDVAGVQPAPSICLNEKTTLTAAPKVPNTTGLTYDWQYLGKNFLGFPQWLPLGTSATSTFSFAPSATIFPGGLSVNTNASFRVRTRSADLTSDWGPPTSYSFSPPGPTVASVTPVASCPIRNSSGKLTGTKPTGKIILSGVNGLGSYRYIIRKDHNRTKPCDPNDPQNPCLDLAEMDFPSGVLAGPPYEIANVPPGKFTLWIINNGANQGVCAYVNDTVTVEALPILQLNTPVVTPVGCYGKSEGSITVSSTGGKPNISYSLLNTAGTPLETKPPAPTDTEVVFNGLAAGTYQVMVKDDCSQSAVKTVVVTQPASLVASTPLTIPLTCTNPSNSEVTIHISATSGTFDTPPSGTYFYQLYKGDQPFEDAVQNTDMVWKKTGLPAGADYNLRVKDALGSECNGVTVSFVLTGPDPLQVGTPQITHVTCYGGSNGAISVTGNNGLDTPFRYLLTKDGVALPENRTGTFTSLTAGTYTVTKMRTIDGCTDASTSASIVISQPAVLAINYTRLNVSCYDRRNGRITASVTGGTEPYAYQWQRLLSGDAAVDDNWSGLSGQVNSTLPNLEPGTYRLRVRDAHSCLVVSPAISITEPALLEITAVNVHDITCFGEKGTLEPLVRGGTAPYTLEYTTNNGGTYATFTAATPLLPGTYRVRVTDRNGCQAGYDTPLTITAPPAALSFTPTLSDYNGYHVSCFGGSNGTATLAAAGGNGADYAGYTYALDNGAYQDDATLTGITAGTHTLRVKDARGCVVSQTVTFTQPDAALFLALSGKTDILCYGEATGELTVSVTGGTAPYQFSRDGVAFQSDSQFTGLAAGDYVITVRDVNGCSTTLPVRLLHLHQPIVITASITNVSCYDGNDGRIEITAGGGAGGYQYAWTSLEQTGASAGNLKIGTYPLRITDAAGCRKDTLFTIGQPDAPLSLYVHNTPVCADRSNGVIDLSPRGGTPPYRHSIDNGLSFQPGNRFLVGVGTYPIVVQDSQGCTVTATTPIVQRNDRPEPNFLIATRQNAFDTLVVKETSLPKADSVHWSFDPRSIVIDADPYSPKIRFTDPGTYLVTMTGYFGGCDYSLTKTLTVSPFDPVAVAPLAANTALIRELAVTPNPNDGRFSFTVKLVRTQPLSVVVVDVLGNEYYRKSWGQATEVTENLQLERAASGFYILRAIVPTDAKETRVLLNKQ